MWKLSWQHLEIKPKSAIFTALDYLFCLLGWQQAWIGESEIQSFPFTVQFACQLQTFYSGDSISQFPSSPSHWINTHHLSLLTKGFFFFFATLCSFYGSLVPGIKSGSSAVRALSPNPWISREFPVYLQRALGELRGKKKTNVLMVNTKHLGSGYQKKSRKGRLEAEYQLFFFFFFWEKIFLWENPVFTLR